MIYFEIISGIVLIVAFIHFIFTKKRNEHQSALIAQHINTSEEMKRTLAMGMYYRFRNEYEPDKYSAIFIKGDPLAFEYFVTDIFEKARGGSTYVFPSSGDFGVDFEHIMDDGTYLGQVKCYKNDVPFDPIAIIHSNMVKQDAAGGYVITTSAFTKAARQYAEDLNIELIDGVKLVELWLEGVEYEDQEIAKLLPKANGLT